MNIGDKVIGKVVKVRDDGLVIKLVVNDVDVYAFLHISRVPQEVATIFNDYFHVDDTVTSYVFQYNEKFGKCMLTLDRDFNAKQKAEKLELLKEDFTELGKMIPIWIESTSKKRREKRL